MPTMLKVGGDGGGDGGSDGGGDGLVEGGGLEKLGIRLQTKLKLELKLSFAKTIVLNKCFMNDSQRIQ